MKEAIGFTEEEEDDEASQKQEEQEAPLSCHVGAQKEEGLESPGGSLNVCVSTQQATPVVTSCFLLSPRSKQSPSGLHIHLKPPGI